MNNLTNGSAANSNHLAHSSVAECPTCGSKISRDQYEKILHISETREKQLRADRAIIDSARREVTEEREKIVKAAVAAERERQEKEKKVEQKKLDEQKQKLIQETAADTERKFSKLVDDLRKQVKTVEERRLRDEQGLKQTIATLQAKAEDRDRGHFGPEGEEELLRLLKEQFPTDKIEHRGKKGDVLHTVMDGTTVAGVVVYEVKNTRGWQLAYLRQTKIAMEEHGTKYGVLVSRSLPAKNSGVCLVDGVIVTEPSLAVHVVSILRSGMVTISRLRLSSTGKSEKTDALFDYLRGDDFAASIERIQDRINDLREALGRERSYHDGWWRTREQHYGAILRESSSVESRVKDALEGAGIKRAS